MHRVLSCCRTTAWQNIMYESPRNVPSSTNVRGCSRCMNTGTIGR